MMINPRNTGLTYTPNAAGERRFSGSKVLSRPYDNEQLKGLFRQHDANGDGRLSLGELKKAFASLGSFAPGWRAFRARCHADKNKDGYIDDAELDYLVKYAAKQGYTTK